MSTTLATATADTQTGNLSFDEALESEIAADLQESTDTQEAPKLDDEEKNKTPEVEAEPAETDGDEELKGDPTPDDSDDAPETDTNDAENTDDADPVKVLDAPARWDADGKELFNKFDDATKAYVLDREKAQQAEITRRQMEAAELRKQVEAGTTNQNTELAQVLNQARTQFASKYSDITPQALAEFSAQSPEHAAQAAQVKLEMEAERQTLHDLEIQSEKVRNTEFAQFVEAQEKLLPELAPELVDPEKGKARKAKVVEYLRKAEVSDDEMTEITALGLAMSYKAMKYDALIAQKKTAKPSAPRSGKPVKVAPARSSGGINAKAQLAKMIKASDGSMESEIAIQLFEDEHFT